MDYVRQTIDSRLLDKLQLPRNLRNRKVEIIIMPAKEDNINGKQPVEELIGVLHEYADPELIHMEKEAWAKAAENKYAGR